jgi:predicted secreted protein
VRRARTRARARLLGEFLALDATQAQTFGIEDTGKSVALAVGERMLVRLPTAAGTGYGWHLAFGADLGPLALVRQTTEGNRARRGGDVLEVFVLEARAVGEARLEFGLYAPYPSAPIETVVLIVVVTP